ncbi:ANTAR domain-containing protein [Hymenobacter glacialis]|uniref:Response regulatory domain-containing protein n=1 Tax=Hymenobacter glacialis TaxID=1908236 RepID=A0A1G1T321_9BACT|nr:hypothetical protein [Hymenobacter glacialis]OGX85270.1 hypothetical protein BEN48_14790 [Hymenobacter glacialis]
MSASPLRVLVAIDDVQRAAALVGHLRAAGLDEIIVAEARGDAALKAARLLHPDLVVVGGPLRGPLDGAGLATSLQVPLGISIPVLTVTDPAELPGLLVVQAQLLAAALPVAAATAGA